MNIVTIIQLTIKTALNKRMFWLSLFVGIILGVAALMLATISLDQNERLVNDILLAGIPLCSFAISIVVSAYMVLIEQDKGALLIILSKPISRTVFIIGKFIGLIITAIAIMTTIGVTSLIVVSLTYKITLVPMLLSLYVSSLELYLLVAIAVLLATISSPIISTLLTVGLFILGHQLELIYYAASQGGRVMHFFGALIYYLLPNLEKYNLREYFDTALSLPASYFGWTTVYTLVYVTLIVFLATYAMNKREW